MDSFKSVLEVYGEDIVPVETLQRWYENIFRVLFLKGPEVYGAVVPALLLFRAIREGKSHELRDVFAAIDNAPTDIASDLVRTNLKSIILEEMDILDGSQN